MSDQQGPEQRLRIEFAKGAALKYISHLDLARAWERVFHRAALPMAYSQGFNPRPRFQIASALPVGVTGRAELLDAWLETRMDPQDVLSRLGPNLPDGLDVLSVQEVDLRATSLQSRMRTAEYLVEVDTAEPVEGIEIRVRALLEAPTLPRQRHHKGRMRSYDLRPLIRGIEVRPGTEGEVMLRMRVQNSPQGAGRPDEILDALGLSVAPHTIERTKLHFEFDK
ncbi:MAG: TIGR03936 family radical SAM-associated protein [Anaerolineae bacterium]